MRRYTDLTDAEKAQAVDKRLTDLLQVVAEGGIRFNDTLNGNDLQARIDTASKQAEKMQTPWFAGEYIMDAVGDDLRSMAIPDAEDAYYPDKGERTIQL